MRILAGVCTLAVSWASFAHAGDVDWKLYGGASVSGPSMCFYDAGSVTRDKFIRVWIKCIAQKDLDNVNADDDAGKRIVESAARRIAFGYVPPIIAIGKMQSEQIPDVAFSEATANLGAIQQQAKIFYELNCSGRMMRRLSTLLEVNGRSGFQNKPSEWDYVPPEGNAANLLKILCLP